uniref:flocculation protein FLO11-like isoform X1 n=1 Tax=Oncorhynchus gorbuscha TaxID=8017 RepID=UPI001EAEF77A|nr:flocculation protein FLO11-like isoform X1 [Oncorhynchus gorbuscha]XP_046193935.1 flocculation protein FLO11-like isoform X2 [Oncorhynchus gorbuscha]
MIVTTAVITRPTPTTMTTTQQATSWPRPTPTTTTTTQQATSWPRPTPTTTTTTQQATSWPLTEAHATPTTISTITTMNRKLNKPPKKPNKSSKKPKPHPATTTTTTLPVSTTPRRDPDPIRTTEKLQPATEPATSTTTSTGATATTKSPAAIEPLIPRTTPENELVLMPKGVQATPASPGTEGQGRGKEVAGQGALKSSLVAVVVVGLAILTLALAVVGRKAMESFDRRHYTRLELNDLHYEV